MTRNRHSPLTFPHAWASEWGQDQYGLWQAFTYKNIHHAFRWIPPGTFTMGSPAGEEGRLNQEDLHQVTLTKGFWPGETTVTQNLWQAVMDKNPSHFNGDELPVEKVSWDDCQQFIEAFSQVHPDLQLRLPWEAEWEYACRAGISTPFSFGGKDDLTLDKVNYSGKWDDYDLDGETKLVKSYPANDWGLYEMHGNVWEWCQDIWQENLGTEAVIDPIDPEEQPTVKEAWRLFRGGSWGIRDGRNCHPAVRDKGVPEHCYDNIGFRLSLGH